MPDREKVIKWFECCHVMVHDLGPDKTSCGICPYKDVQTEEQIELGGIECIATLHDEALALLKEQETDIGNLNETVKNLLNAYTEIKEIYGDSVRVVGELVRCKDCKYRFVDGDNVRFNMCLLNHNKVQPDDWFCADGERK